MPKTEKKEETKNSVVLMYAVLGGLIFILAMIIAMNFFI